VDDEPRREPKDLTRERELLGTYLPERRQPLVEDAVTEKPADHAVLALHRVEIAVTVAPPDRHPRDEVMEDEVVEDDGAGRPSQRVEDPAVCVRIVANMVNSELNTSRRSPDP